MKEKALLFICSIYIILIGFISPIWIGIVYMFITGHGKGYGYGLFYYWSISSWTN